MRRAPTELGVNKLLSSKRLPPLQTLQVSATYVSVCVWRKKQRKGAKTFLMALIRNRIKTNAN